MTIKLVETSRDNTVRAEMLQQRTKSQIGKMALLRQSCDIFSEINKMYAVLPTSDNPDNFNFEVIHCR